MPRVDADYYIVIEDDHALQGTPLLYHPNADYAARKRVDADYAARKRVDADYAARKRVDAGNGFDSKIILHIQREAKRTGYRRESPHLANLFNRHC